jgi:epoxyqueuosine reductase QueG
MTESLKIIEYARALFDIAGSTRRPDSGSLLILGLESTLEHNLDEFVHLKGKFLMPGFRKFAKEKLDLLVKYIQGFGFSAELAGRYGYPLDGAINLKKEAIRAGLGKRGKNTLVVHPVFGARLRLMAIRTDAWLEPESPEPADEAAPGCAGCSICIDACPAGVLKPYVLPDISLCLSNITGLTSAGRSILCDKCVELCPMGRVHNL